MNILGCSLLCTISKKIPIPEKKKNQPVPVGTASALNKTNTRVLNPGDTIRLGARRGGI